jgi:hypothetical protein
VIKDSTNGKLSRDCFNLLNSKPGEIVRLQCTRFEFINAFFPGVYKEIFVVNPFTGAQKKKIVLR